MYIRDFICVVKLTFIIWNLVRLTEPDRNACSCCDNSVTWIHQKKHVNSLKKYILSHTVYTCITRQSLISKSIYCWGFRTDYTAISICCIIFKNSSQLVSSKFHKVLILAFLNWCICNNNREVCQRDLFYPYRRLSGKWRFILQILMEIIFKIVKGI